MRYQPDLDGLRAFAVIAVIASHLELPFTTGGWMGVDIFFVLSGYLITALLLTERDRAGAVSLRRFYLRRGLRLYPALLFALLAGTLLAPVFAGNGQPLHYVSIVAAAGLYVSDFIAGFIGTGWLGAFSHTWSLAVEEHFYLLWPVALILMLRRGRNPIYATAAATALSLLILVISSQFISHDEISDTAYYLPWSRFWTLLLGCTIALALHRGIRIPGIERAWVGAVIAAAAVTVMLAGSALSRTRNFAWEDAAIGVIAGALLWHLVTTQRSPVRAALALKPFSWLGRRSYGVYLYHVPIMWLLAHEVFTRFPVRRLTESLVVIVLTIAFAALSYRFVELPFLRMKSRLGSADKRANAPAAEAAEAAGAA